MLTGLLLCIGTGLLWTLIGILFTRISKSQDHPLTYMASALFFTALWAWLFTANWYTLGSGSIPALEAFLPIIILAGALNSAYSIFMLYAMRRGHNAVTWTIGQSAMVVPFLASLVFWHDRVIWNGSLGVGIIFFSILILGFGRSREEKSGRDYVWLVLAICTFLCVGISQTLFTIPSRWQGWTDAASLRIPVSTLAGFLLQAGILLRLRKFPGRQALLTGFFQSIISIVGQRMLFAGMDILGSYGMVSVVYPLSVGVCIVGVSLYSLLIMKERFKITEVSGIAAGLAGIILISWH